MMSNTNLKKIEGHISNLIRIRNSICAITIAIEQLQQIADSKPGAK